MPDLDTFLDALASSDPVPGGGSVAALQVSMSAALLAMVANLTIGRKRYAAVQERALTLRGEALVLRSEARQLMDDDVDAYGRVAAAMKMPRETDEETAERRRRMQEALKGAAEPPLQTMRTASRVLDLAEELAEIGNRSAISDVGTAAEAARAGYEAAKLNVEINLASVEDKVWVAATRRRMDEIPPVHGRATKIFGRVVAAIRG